MKRSEMVDLICRNICHEIGGQYSSFYEHAEAALYACEKAGMLPPIITENEIDPSNPFLNNDKNEWEPENE